MGDSTAGSGEEGGEGVRGGEEWVSRNGGGWHTLCLVHFCLESKLCKKALYERLSWRLTRLEET